jgi:hypothetical protein
LVSTRIRDDTEKEMNSMRSIIAAMSAGAFLMAAVIGCSSLDHRLMSACRVDQSTGQYVDYQSCQRARDQVSSEKAWAAEMERRDSEEAARKADEAERATAQARAAHDDYWTPERLEEHNSPAAKRERAAASKAYAVQQEKEDQALVTAVREVRTRWTRDHRLALRNNGEPLRRFPDRAWLSGIWCMGTNDKSFHRYEILDNGRIRAASYTSDSRSSSIAGSHKTYYAVRLKDSLYMLTRIQFPTIEDPYKLKYGGAYSERAIRKINDNEYSLEWSHTVYQRGGPDKKKTWNHRYQRCETG